MKQLSPRIRLAFLGALLLVFLGMGLPMVSPAEAAIVPCGRSIGAPVDEQVPCTTCHLIVGIYNIVEWLRNVMVAFSITAIVAMGILYIVSTGNQSLMETAKGGLTAALIGFAVVLAAWLIVNIIFTLPIFSPSGLIKTDWNTFKCDPTSAVRT